MEQLNALARPIAVQTKSLVRASVTVSSLQADLKEQAQDNNIYIIFTDNSGNVLSQITPGAESPRLDISPDQLPHNLNAQTNGELVTIEGETYLFAAFPLAKAGVAQALARYDTLVLATPRTSTSNILAGLYFPFLSAGLAVLALALVIAVFLSRSVFVPINRVRLAAEKMTEGNYDQEIPVAGPGEVRELASSFNKMAVEVKKSQSRLRHYVADVSHQLKSPLTSIHGFAQALLDGTAGDDAARQRAAAIISDESKRMKHQVDELLELARMQSGQLKMEREPVNINELLEHCREVFEVQAEEKQVKVKIDAEKLLPCTGDFDRLEQAFGNILDNAIKNSPAGEEIKITGRNAEQRRVEVRVADNGAGIPPEQLPHLFERFYQSGGVRSGYGLGLAIAREIIAGHGGDIKVKSEPGEGAEFTITLPAIISP
jgi:signal transduction histidine kinase